jgi:hypothetical protein
MRLQWVLPRAKQMQKSRAYNTNTIPVEKEAVVPILEIRQTQSLTSHPEPNNQEPRLPRTREHHNPIQPLKPQSACWLPMITMPSFTLYRYIDSGHVKHVQCHIASTETGRLSCVLTSATRLTGIGNRGVRDAACNMHILVISDRNSSQKGRDAARRGHRSIDGWA